MCKQWILKHQKNKLNFKKKKSQLIYNKSVFQNVIKKNNIFLRNVKPEVFLKKDTNSMISNI